MNGVEMNGLEITPVRAACVSKRANPSRPALRDQQAVLIEVAP